MTAATSSPGSPASAAGARHLDGSLLRGLAWTGIAKGTTQLLRWVATFAIARLLTPADYGLVGMAMVYVGFVQLFNEFGLNAAIIQNRSLSKSDIAQLSGFALLLAAALFALSAGLAGPVAWFFGEPAVRWIVVVLSAKFLIDAAAMPSRALMARDLRFKRLAVVEGVEAVALVVVTLGAAIAWRSYWALVAGLIVSSVLAAVVAIASSPFKPAVPRHLSAIRGSVMFGRDVVISTLAWYAYSNADFLVVGRVLSNAALGAYTIAWNIASIPVEKTTVMLNRVAPPIFAAIQRDTAALRRYFLGLTEGLAFITFPVSVGLALVAEEFILTALGQKWVDAIVPMQLLALYAGFRSVMSLPPLVFVARGHTREARNFALIAAVVLPVAFFIGSRWGTAGVAAAWIVASPLCTIPLNLRYSFRILELSASRFVRALWPASSGTAIMAAVVLLLRSWLPDSIPVALRLVALAGVGAAVYGGYMLAAHGARLRAYRDNVKLARAGAAATSPPASIDLPPDR
ncbi:MAG TPA: lipopolysaccharide biosynthesis protein [Gemmatimonadaceae bacterium]|nr:lipopolysaccharide biosynthesis protein [Gemmatimonadaceae bacterium]